MIMLSMSIMTGNTPTGVGKTKKAGLVTTSKGKHPHGRGEDHAIGKVGAGQPETPPRAWGRPRLVDSWPLVP